MIFSPARQSLALGVTTLIVVASAALVRMGYAQFPEGSVAGIAAPLGGYISMFQTSNPLWSGLTALLMLAFCGIYIGRFTVRYGFYPFKTCLPIALYGIVACGIYTCCDCLTVCTASVLLVLAIKYFYLSFRAGHAFSCVFRASLYLGFIPLIYTPAIILVVLILPAVVIFKRTLREFIVAVAGVSLPVFVLCYINWAAGYGFILTAKDMWQAIMTYSGYTIFHEISVFTMSLFCLLLFIVVCSVFFYAIDAYSSTSKSRSMLLFDIVTLAVILSMFFLPSSTAGVVSIAAIPAAMVMPVMFIRINKIVSLLLYLGLLAFCLLSVIIAR